MANFNNKRTSGISLSAFILAAVMATGCGGGGIEIGDFIDHAKAKWDLDVEFDAGGKIDILKLLGI